MDMSNTRGERENTTVRRDKSGLAAGASGSAAESLVNDILKRGGWEHPGTDEVRHRVAERELCRAIDAEAVGHRGGCQFRTVGDRFEALAALFRELTLGVSLGGCVGGGLRGNVGGSLRLVGGSRGGVAIPDGSIRSLRKGLRLFAQTLAETSDAAVRNCNTATAAADKSKAAADIAAKSATDAATETNTQRELTEQSRQRLEAVADRAELAAAPVPDGLRVDCPAQLTLGNPVPHFISARVLPPSALQNVIYQAFGGAAGSACGQSAFVAPDGRILPLAPGVTHVHVIPTGGTRLYKTVTVQVVAPALRLAAPGVLRLDSAGNIRLT